VLLNRCCRRGGRTEDNPSLPDQLAGVITVTMGRCITFFFLCGLLSALPPSCHHGGRQREAELLQRILVDDEADQVRNTPSMTQILWRLGLGCGWGQRCAWGERDVDGGWGTWSSWLRKQVVDGGCVQAAATGRVREMGRGSGRGWEEWRRCVTRGKEK
jgi:hypothetical protein